VEVVTLLLFVGAAWVAGAVALFAWTVLRSGHEHSERLAILPLEDNWKDPRAAGGGRERIAQGKVETR
jgi:hypothetical protein